MFENEGAVDRILKERERDASYRTSLSLPTRRQFGKPEFGGNGTPWPWKQTECRMTVVLVLFLAWLKPFASRNPFRPLMSPFLRQRGAGGLSKVSR